MQVPLRGTCGHVGPGRVRFTITPLGGTRQDLGAVVDAIVDYLQPRSAGIVAPAPSAHQDGASRYYADDGEEAGRWIGAGAPAHGLSGEVVTADLAAVLAGRDPRTGERLITAQGSAGRRPNLGVGQVTKLVDAGTRVYDEPDAAAALGVSRAEVARMLDIGTALALGHLSAFTQAGERANQPAGTRVHAMSQVGGSYLVPIVDAHGDRWIAERELDRCASAREHDVDPDLVRALGDGDDLLPIADAARIAGVTVRYLRRLAATYERDRAEIERRAAAGDQPRGAFLVAQRGTRDQWLVSRTELVAFLERRTPPAVRVGFDLTLTTEKSLGVLALLSDAPVSHEVLDAIQTGNDWAMGWLEERAAWARERGESIQAEGGWTVASYRHLTSRSLDPFPHHHNVLVNSVTLPDGSRRALDARRLYQHARAASALATAEMRRQLSLRLGVQWRRSRNGDGWEVAGIDDRVLHEFSRRRNEIDEALRELEEELGRGADPAEVDDIVLRTRPKKTHTSPAQLVADWRRRAARLGLGAKKLRAICGSPPPEIVEPTPDVMWNVLARKGGVTDGGSVFTRADALVIAADVALQPAKGSSQPLLIGAARIEALVDSFLTSPYVIRLDDSDDPLFTTVEMLGVQERIADRFTAGLSRGPHRVREPAIQGVLAQHDYLTDEQRALVRAWCRDGHRFQAAIGRAGTGKTTTVAACARAWEHAGYRVRGAAVKGEAARTLAAATGIRCETLAWYLAHADPDDLPLDARTILVVDECSTVSDRDLDAVMTMALRSGASVRLIGDPAQHGAVEAGGMFRVLCAQHPETPELRATHRVKNAEDRAAAEALRNGRIDEALDLLASAGHLHIVDDELTLHREVLSRWWAAHLAGEEHPMVDRRNATRRQLNRLAHVMLRAHGAIGHDEITASGDRRFSVGDRVAARTPARDLHVARNPRAYVRNGARGTVAAISTHRRRRRRDTITVDFDGIGPIVIPRAFFDEHLTMGGKREVGIDHAYALTSYAVQGATHEVSTSRIDPTASRSETYVDITRGRRSNHLYLTRARSPLDGETLPREPEPPIEEEVGRRLARSSPEMTAYELVHAASSERQRPRRQSVDARGL